ncbi:ATP-dependent DNA helicase [Trichonephila clavipes]|nr:ATP-dependent DNA helicase [Trichonephila clavipes]
MSASARARASQKYKSRLSFERGGYGLHTGTPMSGAERARRFQERRKADAATQSRRIGTMERKVLQNYRITARKCFTGLQRAAKLDLWQSLDYYPLEQVMRQRDSTFSEILTKIGNGERLGTEQIALIESRLRSRAWCKVNVPVTVRLFHRNHDVDAYNNNAFIPEFENIADDKMIGSNTLTEVATARRNLHKMSVVESDGLPYSLKLAVGYPYMITMNLDVEDGLVNGAIGTLKYIEYLTED